MRDARTCPKGVIRMVDKNYLAGIAASSECEYRNNVVREEVQHDYVHALAQPPEFTRLFQLLCGWCAQNSKKATRVFRCLFQDLRYFINAFNVGLCSDCD